MCHFEWIMHLQWLTYLLSRSPILLCRRRCTPNPIRWRLHLLLTFEHFLRFPWRWVQILRRLVIVRPSEHFKQGWDEEGWYGKLQGGQYNVIKSRGGGWKQEWKITRSRLSSWWLSRLGKGHMTAHHRLNLSSRYLTRARKVNLVEILWYNDYALQFK